MGRKINDVLFISSFFVLGGEFWDKLQALFIYDVKVELLREEKGQIQQT